MSAEYQAHGFVTRPDEGVPGRGPEVKASGHTTRGSLTVMDMVVDGLGPPPHVHTREDESIYVLTGKLEVECGEDRMVAGPGSFVFLPRDVAHTFRSIDGTATGLLIVTPGGLDEYFAELHDVITAGGERTEVARVQAKYGIARS